MFCNVVCSVTDVLGHEYNPFQWRLFNNSSNMSVKVVLLHNGNRFPSVLLALAANMKESYKRMKLILGKIKCDEFKWKLCGDLQVVALLLGMQPVYVKYRFFLCEFDSRGKKNHCVTKLWPKRTSLKTRKKNVISLPLVLLKKIYLPSLHIGLRLMKNFVKSMDKTDHGFECFRNKFPSVSDAKIKEGVFIGPQIRELVQEFDEDLNGMKEMHGRILREFARTS